MAQIPLRGWRRDIYQRRDVDNGSKGERSLCTSHLDKPLIFSQARLFEDEVYRFSHVNLLKLTLAFRTLPVRWWGPKVPRTIKDWDDKFKGFLRRNGMLVRLHHRLFYIDFQTLTSYASDKSRIVIERNYHKFTKGSKANSWRRSYSTLAIKS